MKQKLAISYVRFSTIEQRGGDSIRRQTEATEAYCKRNGLTLTNDYRLRDLGKSAFKGVHRTATGALGQLEKQVADGKIPKGRARLSPARRLGVRMLRRRGEDTAPYPRIR